MVPLFFSLGDKTMIKFSHAAQPSQTYTMSEQPAAPKPPIDPRAWRTDLVSDLDRVAARDRWGYAMMSIGAIHFAAFTLCEFLYTSGDLRETPYVAIWLFELAAVLLTMQYFGGRYWWRATPLAGILGRVWGTFLLLSFNLTTMNSMLGLAYPEWFKPALTNLATFGFATTAYLLTPRYFIPAVGMYFTGLLMVALPRHAYIIHGSAWLLTLLSLGVILERRRRRLFPEFVAARRGSGEARRNRRPEEDFASTN
jgi:hypothetical protein